MANFYFYSVAVFTGYQDWGSIQSHILRPGDLVIIVEVYDEGMFRVLVIGDLGGRRGPVYEFVMAEELQLVSDRAALARLASARRAA